MKRSFLLLMVLALMSVAGFAQAAKPALATPIFRDRGFERADRCGIVPRPLVELGDHVERHREHHGTVHLRKAGSGGRKMDCR